MARFASREASQPPQGSERDKASQVLVSLAARPTRVALSRLAVWSSLPLLLWHPLVFSESALVPGESALVHLDYSS